jgi:hypothetical protein
MLRVATTLAAPIVVVFAVEAAALTIVPGSANPNLAGRSAGYSCCGGDSSPGQDPALVLDVEINSCDSLEITASGKVSFEPGVPVGNNPDGDTTYSMTNYGDGISAPMNVRTNALVGVFLTDDSPTGEPTPDQLSFGGENGLAFGYLYPQIGQIFFIGDGLSSDSATGATNGFLQHFIAPPGATQLYLGTVDGSGWLNNSGSFTVAVENEEYDPPAPCGDAVDPPGITTSDSLRILRAAVGSSLCIDCVCDTDNSGSIAASDALAVLRVAVGQDVDLICACCFFV